MTSLLSCVRDLYHPWLDCGRKPRIWWPFAGLHNEELGGATTEDRDTGTGAYEIAVVPVQATEKPPKGTRDASTQTEKTGDGLAGIDVLTQTGQGNLTADAWCQVDDGKLTKKTVEIVATKITAVEEAEPVAEANAVEEAVVSPPSSPPTNYTTEFQESTLSSTFVYWKDRFSLFSKFERGVMLDEAFIPYVLAAHMARRCPYETVVDPFCGAGGNAIQLALACRRVIAVDVVYGVAGRIDFRIGDAFEILSGANVTSPPWGGPYDVEDTCSRDRGGLAGVLGMARAIAPRVVVRLPSTIDRAQCLSASRGRDFGRVELEHVTIDGRPDSVNVYAEARRSDTPLLGPAISSEVHLDSGYRRNANDRLVCYSAYLNRTNEFLSNL